MFLIILENFQVSIKLSIAELGVAGYFMSCFAILAEKPGRWAELAMNVFPRWLESVPVFMRKIKFYPERIPLGAVNNIFLFVGDADGFINGHDVFDL